MTNIPDVQMAEGSASEILKYRRGNYDVTNTVCVSDPKAVSEEVCRLFQLNFPSAPMEKIEQAFIDFESIYTGNYPGYYAAETPYHDIQHCLDVTLCMTRLMIGYNRYEEDNVLDAALAELGIIVSLFHDVGFIRQHGDEATPNGAVYIPTHVSRGGNFLAKYLPTLGLGHQTELAGKLLHFTGYEMAVSSIQSESPQQKLLGYMIASSDLLAQMADRCYLEKCSNRLYEEFIFAQMACPEVGGKNPEDFQYASRDDMMKKTTGFMQSVIDVRLQETLGGVHNHIKSFFGGLHLYMDAMEKNKRYLEEKMMQDGWQGNLRRKAIWTLVTDQFTP